MSQIYEMILIQLNTFKYNWIIWVQLNTLKFAFLIKSSLYLYIYMYCYFYVCYTYKLRISTYVSCVKLNSFEFIMNHMDTQKSLNSFEFTWIHSPEFSWIPCEFKWCETSSFKLNSLQLNSKQFHKNMRVLFWVHLNIEKYKYIPMLYILIYWVYDVQKYLLYLVFNSFVIYINVIHVFLLLIHI